MSDPEADLRAADERLAAAERAVALARAERERVLIMYVAFVAKQEGGPSNQLLSVKEAAQRLKVNESTIWRMVGNGTLPSRTIGRSRRIAEADLRLV
jgi:excisionase family DNA binding protein